ncbi:Peptidase family S41 [Niabella drilacis]|uniref:Peptidase family S41 n=2 Tax=Niabella drilacis (strain DSM 25811 / CCM 8410 / CCUG 62505 / LMG 26954 / E90) TaxID=1285928 RepID=A0A1G7C6G5_NIADE|nr:Peptidase family S41 [Niabella drilacis]
MKGNKQDNYINLFNRLSSDTTSELNNYKYFYNLSQLLFPLRDNHLGFYQLPDYKNFKTKETIDSFIATKEFYLYPTCEINIDSLKIELAKKPADSIEGIYHYDKFYSVGLFRSGDREYIGVVLDTNIKLWQKGQIAIHLYEYIPNHYKAIYGHPLYKNFLLQTNEKYKNQSLVNSYFYGSYSQSIYTKELGHADYMNLPTNSSKFELKTISDNIQYLLIRTFQADKSTMLSSQKFYDSITSALNKTYLVLDLRNNEGGAKKEMKKYFSLLKKYTKHGHLYILLNNGTLSQAEIFTLKLQKLKNVTTVGQTTKGMLTYGSNYGKRNKLPSGKFEIYPTDMKGDAKLLKYEDYGIKPKITLENDQNWIEQVTEIIEKK